ADRCGRGSRMAGGTSFARAAILFKVGFRNLIRTRRRASGTREIRAGTRMRMGPTRNATCSADSRKNHVYFENRQSRLHFESVPFASEFLRGFHAFRWRVDVYE